MHDFYQEQAADYFAATARIDPTSFLKPLAERLPPGAAILDVGCGSGRDLKWFKERGFAATGFEQAPELARRAREHSGCPVIEGDFCTYDFSRLSYDAVILVGALVHLPESALAPTLRRILQALKPDGLLYLTLKEGRGPQPADDGRTFILWPENRLRQIFADLELTILDFSRNTSKLRLSDTWLGFILKRRESR
jgi:SAM-dependent methyltransferase